MKYNLVSNRFKALFGIVIIAVSIGAISKKLISYPAGECIKRTQELTLKGNKEVLS